MKGYIASIKVYIKAARALWKYGGFNVFRISTPENAKQGRWRGISTVKRMCFFG